MDQVVFNLLASKQTSATSLTVLPPTPRLRCPPPAAEWAQTGSVRHCTAETGPGVGAKYLRDYEGMINVRISVTIPIIQKQSEETDLWQQFSVKLSSYWKFLEHPEYFGRRLLTESSVVSRARSEGGSTSHHNITLTVTTSQHHT